jgi:hypothetical protein
LEKFQVKIYQEEYFSLWNNFVANAKNATFLFHRDFMEYHQDRFNDFSLLIFDSKEKLVAILPANILENEVFSHQGLTYGGLVILPKTYFNDYLNIFKTILKFLFQNNIITLFYKEVPSFFNTYFSDEFHYIIFQAKGKLIKKEIFSVIDLKKEFSFNKGRNLILKKNLKEQYQIKNNDNPDNFWNKILQPLLTEKYQTKPTHSLEEIKKLMQLFSHEILLYEVWEQEELKAGTVLFISKNVVHCQYISKKIEKNNYALDYLFQYLIFDRFKDFDYFDFGTSHQENGSKINNGLLFWKESFGAKSVVQNYYSIPTKNYNLLDNILI